MKKILFSAAIAASLSCASLAAQAADNAGLFVSGQVGQAHYDIGGGFGDHGTTYGGTIGYRWAVEPPFYFGLETGFVDLGKLSQTSYPYGSQAYPEKDKLRAQAVILGVNGRWALASQWYITARAGTMHSHSEYKADVTYPGGEARDRFTSDDNGLYAGVGVGYDITRKFSLGLTYDYYSLKADKIIDGNTSVSVLSVAAEVRF
ncbi:MAG TPA: porin family protein [Luteibacter sp.]|jgi:OOP family OmpA-OmpF porin|nr:porin family protein [Luteibacter sp.]